jgi:hypothetical protein
MRQRVLLDTGLLGTILTFDRDFLIYRKNRNETIPLIMPENT